MCVLLATCSTSTLASGFKSIGSILCSAFRELICFALLVFSMLIPGRVLHPVGIMIFFLSNIGLPSSLNIALVIIIVLAGLHIFSFECLYIEKDILA